MSAEPNATRPGLAFDEPRGALAPAAWRWWYGLVGFAAGMAAVFVTLLPLSALVRAAHVHVIGLGELVGVTVTAAVAVWLARHSGTRVKARDFGFRPTPSRAAVGWTALAVVSYFVAAAIYAAAMHGVQPNAPLHRVVHGTLPAIATALALVVVAPVGEEFFFRGFVYAALRNRLSVLWATLVTGSLFGLVHLASGAASPTAVPVLALAGFALCLLYERTRSLYPNIALHMTMNATAASIAISGRPWAAWSAIGACALVFLAAPWRALPRARSAHGAISSRLRTPRASSVLPAVDAAAAQSTEGPRRDDYEAHRHRRVRSDAPHSGGRLRGAAR